MDLEKVDEAKFLQHHELEKFRREVYENVSIYKERANKCHEKNIWQWIFRVEDQVLLYNFRLKKLFLVKLKVRWFEPSMVS